LVMESSWSMTKEPSIFCKCLGNRPFRWLWAPPSSQALSGDTQFYLHSTVTSTFIQQLNSGNRSKSQGPQTNCGYWNWVQFQYKLIQMLVRNG
jgi:hypothetical protein